MYVTVPKVRLLLIIIINIFIIKIHILRAPLFARALLANYTRLVDNRTRGINIR